MDINVTHLAAIRKVCRALASKGDGWNATLDGTLTLTPDLYDALDTMVLAGLIPREIKVGYRYLDWNSFSSTSREEIELELSIVDWAQGAAVVYRNLDTLINRGLFLLSAPECVYLVEEDLIIPPDTPSDTVKRYLEAVAVADWLSRQADHTDHAGGKLRLIFLHKVSLPIQVRFSAGDLTVPIEGLGETLDLFSSDEHKEQKRSLLKASLYNLLGNERESDRFARLLSHFSEFSCELRENYQLFVSEFNFNEVREELEEKKRDYLSQLNATFNDMGAKLLSIPLAFYVAVTNMRPIAGGSDIFETVVLNTVVTLAVVTVGVYILMLLNSHQHGLRATVDEYNSLLDRWQLRLKYAEQRNRVVETRKALDRRRRRVVWYFRITFASVFGMLAITLVLYVMRVLQKEPVVWSWMRAFKGFIFP